MIIEKKDINNIANICDFFESLKFKYSELDGLYDLSEDVEISIDRLLAAMEEEKGQ
jgi:hypothetical protein